MYCLIYAENLIKMLNVLMNLGHKAKFFIFESEIFCLVD